MNTWKKICVASKISTKTEKRFITTDPDIPVMYILIKTHKLTPSTLNSTNPSDFKIRPIISGCGGPADKVSWILSKILSPLFKFIPSYISNSNEFLNKINNENMPTNGHVHYCSFDIENLFTNVHNDEAIDAIMEMIKTYKDNLDLFNLTPTCIHDLLKVIFKTNIFKFMNKLYKQLRGLAMGNRLAPIMAIIFIHKLESTIIHNLQPIIFSRYVDDTFIVTRTSNDSNTLFNDLNNAHSQITFTREDPSENGLPFLNCNILNYKNGKFTTTWFRKTTSKNIILHANSDHPSYMKQNVVKNMLLTSQKLSSTPEEKEKAKKLATEIAISNGYTGCNFTKIKGPGEFKESNTNFTIPFISDDFTFEISTLIKKSGLPISITVKPSPNLKKLLTKSKLYESKCDTKNCSICPRNIPGDCKIKGAVYELKCECGDTYIGHTGRKTLKRIQEHNRSLNNPDKDSYSSMPLAIHRKEKHGGNLTKITVTILEREPNNKKRLILEATHINLQNPAINRKDEQEQIQQFLMPSKKEFTPWKPDDAFFSLFKNFFV